MRTFLITLTALGLVAAAVPTVTASAQDRTVVITKHGHHDRGLHRGWTHGHHYGWHGGRGHHYGWYRGRGHHYGWRHHGGFKRSSQHRFC